jgi:hypothetical protein
MGIVKEPEIHQTTIQAVAGTGAMTLVINEQYRLTACYCKSF